MNEVANAMLTFVNDNVAWLYLIAIPLFMLFLAYVCLSRYGKMKLGDENDVPEYSFASWFAMLFCGATGIGMVFYSVVQPMSHYVSPIETVEPMTTEAAQFAIRTVFTEWGIVQFSCFAIVGLAMAYFVFRKKKPYTMSAMLEPVFGKSMQKAAGKVVDWYSVIVSICGVATSLGLGCIQIVGGLNYMYKVPNGTGTYIVIIGIVTIIFGLSAISGIKRGIKFLSNLNAVFAICLLVLGFASSNKNEVMLTFANGVGQHLQYLLVDCLGIDPYANNDWILNWRVFYWAWYIAWCPFVGMFFARISRGRTVREFVAGTVIAPSVFTVIWFSVFGSISIDYSANKSVELLNEMTSHPETAVFKVFETIPVGNIMSVLVVALLCIFFITSADSATYSISLLTTNGRSEDSVVRKVIIALIESALAIILLCNGGLKSLQTISIVAALPYTIIMLLLCVSMLKEFRKETLR